MLFSFVFSLGGGNKTFLLQLRFGLHSRTRFLPHMTIDCRSFLFFFVSFVCAWSLPQLRLVVNLEWRSASPGGLLWRVSSFEIENFCVCGFFSFLHLSVSYTFVDQRERISGPSPGSLFSSLLFFSFSQSLFYYTFVPTLPFIYPVTPFRFSAWKPNPVHLLDFARKSIIPSNKGKAFTLALLALLSPLFSLTSKPPKGTKLPKKKMSVPSREETVQPATAMHFTARSPSPTTGRRKSRGRKLIPSVEGDKVIAERFRTKLCRNYLLDPDAPCPYEDRCMFAHGGHELRTAAQNMLDGLTSENTIRLFKQKQKLVTNEPLASLGHLQQFNSSYRIPFSSSLGTIFVDGDPPISPHPSHFPDPQGEQCPFAPPARQLTIPHFLLSVDVAGTLEEEAEVGFIMRASRMSSPSSDRRSCSFHRSSVVSATTTDGTQIHPHGLGDEDFPRQSDLSVRERHGRHWPTEEVEVEGLGSQPPSIKPIGSDSIHIDCVNGLDWYRHDPYQWRAI